mmetsp:Transcript_27223/g.63907  ORF Transcript_27223/g.63907 Transcript_27223/m.63907 type:complete len:236 (+) Transcript_27223:1939-2646(+)
MQLQHLRLCESFRFSVDQKELHELLKVQTARAILVHHSQGSSYGGSGWCDSQGLQHIFEFICAELSGLVRIEKCELLTHLILIKCPCPGHETHELLELHGGIPRDLSYHRVDVGCGNLEVSKVVENLFQIVRMNLWAEGLPMQHEGLSQTFCILLRKSFRRVAHPHQHFLLIGRGENLNEIRVLQISFTSSKDLTSCSDVFQHDFRCWSCFFGKSSFLRHDIRHARLSIGVSSSR